MWNIMCAARRLRDKLRTVNQTVTKADEILGPRANRVVNDHVARVLERERQKVGGLVGTKYSL